VQPLKQEALPLIQWRLRDLSKPAAPVVMEFLPTCGNCHSFSRDARVMSMDIDGPDGDKGAHVVKDVTAHMVVEKQDVFTWNSFRGPHGGYSFGMFPQLSPDGRHIIATVHESIYVQNYKDYGFLQTFYPTRGVLAFYTRATGRIQTLSGADDRRYVQTNAVWSPDGKTLVFLRAQARDPYDGGTPAEYANDPREKQIQFDLYRVPFNEGRGGKAEPLPGAANNGMSNTFPKFSPDGKWIVFVQCRNGMLMRPDGKLYIMPAGGGTPRLMKCNTSRMNSWHSWSPNSRWLVFSSKINTPYTQMFLTHVDEDGNDTPAVLIPNATAANRAVNLPEFAAIPPGGLEDITTPAVDYRRHMEAGRRLADRGRLDEALAELKLSLDLKADYPDTYALYGVVLARQGKIEEAVTYFRRALDIEPNQYVALVNLGAALSEQGKLDEALVLYRRALQIIPDFPAVLNSVGSILTRQGKPAEGIPYFDRVLKLDPGYWAAHYNWGTALVQMGSPDAAVEHFMKVVELNPADFNSHGWLGGILLRQGRIGEAVRHFRKAIELNPEYVQGIHALARILATHADPAVRDGKEAVRLAEIACAKTGQADPQALDTLACAYAETGRFDDAVRAVEKAIGLARSAKNEKLAADLQTHLTLFQKQKPFHE
jgi:tetratricopeptide (TPR) repeat protein